MKQFFKMAVIGLAAVAAFASCEKEDFPSQQEIETKIVGQWKCVESEGKEILTDQRSILTYMGGGKETASLAKTHEVDGFIWSNKEPYSYQVKENELMETRLSNGQNLYTDILSITNDRMEKILKKVVYPDGRISEPNLSMIFSKITPNNFSEDIIGMWEGVEMTGYETYGDAEARIEYKADGTYKYYTKVNDVWQYKPGFNEWNVDGDWLATRWQNEGEDQMNYEWWDIDEIKDGTMKWSALREDASGKRFETTFTWKKINKASDEEMEKILVGRWKSIIEENEEVITDRRSVRTYLSDGTTFISFSRKFQELGFLWANKYLMNYQINDGILNVEDEASGKLYQFAITDIGEDFADFMSLQQEDGVMRTVRVTTDYSQDIIGMWEGVEMTGYETYGNAEARIEYKADGTYTYYVKEGNFWVPSKNVENEYNVDGDWLASRWRPEAGEDFNYEWWDIDEIKDGIMKWSALREKEDGERYTTTFTWKKIERPSDQEIKKNIVGKWKSLSYDGMPLETVERDILTFNADGTEEYSASRFDTELEEYIWSNKGAYTYSISNGVLTETIKDGRIGFTAEVLRADEDILVVNYTSFWKDGEQTATNDLMVFQKVTVDYSDDVIGLWECEDYMDAVNDIRMKVRFEFNADGSYSYYKYADGEWQKSKDTSIEYLVDGDWIAVRYRTDMDTFTFAAWDINEVKEGTMKWSYLIKKADGTPLTTTIDWKRVD